MEGGGGKSPEDFENSFKKKKKHPQFSKQLCWTNDQQSDGGEKNTTEEPEITKFPDSGSKSNAAFRYLSLISLSQSTRRKKNPLKTTSYTLPISCFMHDHKQQPYTTNPQTPKRETPGAGEAGEPSDQVSWVFLTTPEWHHSKTMNN